MRLTGLRDDPGRPGRKHPEPAAAVASAIGHVGIDAEITPARGKTLPIGQASLFQQPPHFRRTHEGKAVALDEVSERSKRVGQREFSGHKMASATARNAYGVASTNNIAPTP